MTSKLNKHKNNVGNWQKAAKCRFCQVGRQKLEIPSIITIILLKKGILTLKMGKGHNLRKIKMFLKEQQLSKLGEKLEVEKGHMTRKSRHIRKHLSCLSGTDVPLRGQSSPPTTPFLTSQGHLSEFLTLPKLRSHTSHSSLLENAIHPELAVGHTGHIQQNEAHPCLEFSAPPPKGTTHILFYVL